MAIKSLGSRLTEQELREACAHLPQEVRDMLDDRFCKHLAQQDFLLYILYDADGIAAKRWPARLGLVPDNDKSLLEQFIRHHYLSFCRNEMRPDILGRKDTSSPYPADGNTKLVKVHAFVSVQQIIDIPFYARVPEEAALEQDIMIPEWLAIRAKNAAKKIASTITDYPEQITHALAKTVWEPIAELPKGVPQKDKLAITHFTSTDRLYSAGLHISKPKETLCSETGAGKAKVLLVGQTARLNRQGASLLDTKQKVENTTL